MVFALLGLASNPLSITPSYHASMREVYVSTAPTIINASRNLDLLCQSPWKLFGNTKHDASLPSWVPDFAHPGNPKILFAQRGIYRASGNEELETPCKVTKEGCILLEGWDVITLQVLRKWDGWPPSMDQRVLEWMPNDLLQERIEAGNESLSHFLTPEEEEPCPRSKARGGERGSGFEEYWRTLMVDCTRYPIARLQEEDLKKLRLKWEAWMCLPWVMETEEFGEYGWSRLVRKGKVETWYSVQKQVWEVWPRSFSVLEDGSFAMVPVEAEKGDRVVVLKGAKTPVLLRRAEIAEGQGKEGWALIGACYVDKMMDGEATRKEGNEVREYVIV